MLEAEWRQVLLGSVSTGAKEEESSTGHVWAAGFRHVTAHSHLAHNLKLMSRYFFNFQIFSGRGKPRITETADTESADTWAHLYINQWRQRQFFLKQARKKKKWLEAAELKEKTQRQNANNGQKCAYVIKQSKILGCKGKNRVTK
jgi:hypothetical protein